MAGPRKSSVFFPAAVTLTVLYVGAYFVLVRAEAKREFPPDDTLLRVTNPRYVAFGTFCDRFFAPLNWMDRKLRVDVWETREVTFKEAVEEWHRDGEKEPFPWPASYRQPRQDWSAFRSNVSNPFEQASDRSPDEPDDRRAVVPRPVHRLDDP